MIGVSAAGIRPHNATAAVTWGAGGHNYDRVSETSADAIEHVVNRLAPRSGERFLDVGTGTGLAARRAAARGADVVGVDIAAGLIEVARSVAPSIPFAVGDAESLAFADQTFDGVISAFGVMFASRPEDVARELARVCRRGGRLGLAAWIPGDTMESLARVIRCYASAPIDPLPSPFTWGRRDRIAELFGNAFAIKFETGVSTLRQPSGKAVWEMFVAGDGPTRAIAASLDRDCRRQLRSDFIAFHDAHCTDLGVAMPREYLVAIGVRR